MLALRFVYISSYCAIIRVLLLESALPLVLVAIPSAVAVVKTAIVERASLAIFLLIIV